MTLLHRGKRTWFILFGIPALAVLLILSQARARTALRLVGGFTALEQDPRIRYEPGAEEMARAIATVLPAAIARVEQCQVEKFREPFRVYVCATHDSFTRHIGQIGNARVDDKRKRF